jgi:hypothetical protein
MEPVEEMRETLKNESFRLYVAVHEAAHIEYARRAGAIGFQYHGPMEYPGRPGVYGNAGVEPVFPTPGVAISLQVMARWYCAPGVVTKRLSPRWWHEGEDREDYEVYRDYCARRTKATPEDVDENWKAAQEDVERDLLSPAFRRKLWDLAHEVERKIPWGIGQ